MTETDCATRFIEGRRSAVGFDDFPGPLPTTLQNAYAIQATAIGGWTDSIAGWKAGRIDQALAWSLGADRLVGPIFSRTIKMAASVTEFPVIAGGFGAFEAELLIRVASDLPATRRDWTAESAANVADAVHIGVEIAGSPLSAINALGPLATIAGFGNNLGLVIGPAAQGRLRSLDMVSCRTTIDGRLVGERQVGASPGESLATFAFALNQIASMDRPARAGQWISTGALTGIHAVVPGQLCVADFGALGTITCRTVVSQRTDSDQRM